MQRKCETSREVMAETAAQKLGEVLGELISSEDLQHYRWQQTFGSTAGPFGGIGGAAMTTFEMDAFSIRVRDDDAELDMAAVFAAGKFWSLRRLTVDIKTHPLPKVTPA